MKVYLYIFTTVLYLMCHCDRLIANGYNKFEINTDTNTTQLLQVDNELSVYNDSVYQHYTTILSELKSKYSKWKYSGSDTLTNPYYYRLFFYSRLSDSIFTKSIGSLNSSSTSAVVNKNSYMNDMLTRCFTENPNYISNIPDSKELNISKPELEKKKDTPPEVKTVKEKATPAPAQPEPIDEFDQAWSLVVKKPNFWTIKSNFSLQFMQTYISSNWHRGGSTHKNLLATWNIYANYDNKRGFKVDNGIEMRIGFQTAQDDDLHRFKTHADQIRMTNKFGLKAAKNWYYTVLLQSWTQFYKGYRANDDKVYSDFMSPFESVLSVGMDYSLKVKNFEFNATLSPFAGKLKYCDRKNLVNNFGLRDKHSRFEFGSNVSGNFKWTIHKNIQWTGRIYYFTDYKKAQIEWENTINLRINKYLSTKLYFYPRFDDSVTKKPGKNYFQFYEQLTVGVDLSF